MKLSKRFIIISLLAALSAPTALACIWNETHNYYLFSVYNREEFNERVDKITRDNWKAYLGQSDDEYFYFDADELKKAARQKGDELMATYVENLDKYLECVRSKKREQYEWDYPTQDEIATRNATLTQVRQYAQGKLTTKLRSQHALLFMRCNMLLGRHGENISFWEQTASKYIETVYKDMMQNIYAGALLKTGHADKAGQLFAEQGDWHSLMTQYYKKRSYQAISQEYQRNPQSAVLPFLVQDFVNNAQEATDADNPLSGGMEGKLFIRDIQRAEAEQMMQLAGRAVREKKTQYPALWQSAKAWLEFMYGNKALAMGDIDQAVAMEGTERMKDNARVLQFYIHAMQTPVGQQFDDYVAGELRWLDQKKEGDYHYDNALDRIVHQALTTKYTEAGRPETALGLFYSVHAYQYENALDTMAVDHLLRFMDYAKNPSQTALDGWIKGRLELNESEMTDLVGTKYLRLCEWEEAEKWLRRVPLEFYNQKGYAGYAAHRSYAVEPWVKRQWLTDSQAYGGNVKLESNPKLDFAREMQKLEGGMSRLSGKALQQRCYDLAVRYAQADMEGDCWFLMHNGKSSYQPEDKGAVDLKAKAVGLLRQASQTTDFKLKESALFALAYYYLNDDHWYEGVWDSNEGEIVRHAKPQSRHFKAWAALVDYERANPRNISTYVSRCDEYIQFLKEYRR